MEFKILIINILPSAILPFLVQLLAHEFGHMLAGNLTGWRLVYLQFFRLVLVKENNRVRIKTLPFQSYRCIMYPKSLDRDASLYTLGGIFMNLLFTAAGLMGMIRYFGHPAIWMYALGLSSSGIILLATNGIPCIGRVCNDMASMLMIKNDQASKKVHNYQMTIARQLFEGRTFRQMDRRLLEVRNVRINTDILAYQAVLEYYLHIDEDEYLLAQEALDNIEMSALICKGVRNVINMERFYLNILMNILRKELTSYINGMPFNETEAFIIKNDSKGDIHSVRVKAAWNAYSYYIEGELDMAIECLDQSLNDMDRMRYLYLGEKLFCMDQLTYLRNMLQRDCITNLRTMPIVEIYQ